MAKCLRSPARPMGKPRFLVSDFFQVDVFFHVIYGTDQGVINHETKGSLCLREID